MYPKIFTFSKLQKLRVWMFFLAFCMFIIFLSIVGKYFSIFSENYFFILFYFVSLFILNIHFLLVVHWCRVVIYKNEFSQISYGGPFSKTRTIRYDEVHFIRESSSSPSGFQVMTTKGRVYYFWNLSGENDVLSELKNSIPSDRFEQSVSEKTRMQRKMYGNLLVVFIMLFQAFQMVPHIQVYPHGMLQNNFVKPVFNGLRPRKFSIMPNSVPLIMTENYRNMEYRISKIIDGDLQEIATYIDSPESLLPPSFMPISENSLLLGTDKKLIYLDNKTWRDFEIDGYSFYGMDNFSLGKNKSWVIADGEIDKLVEIDNINYDLKLIDLPVDAQSIGSAPWFIFNLYGEYPLIVIRESEPLGLRFFTYKNGEWNEEGNKIPLNSILDFALYLDNFDNRLWLLTYEDSINSFSVNRYDFSLKKWDKVFYDRNVCDCDLIFPSDMVVDPKGRLWVVDRYIDDGHSETGIDVIQIDWDGKAERLVRYTELNSPYRDRFLFNSQIAVSKDGYIWTSSEEYLWRIDGNVDLIIPFSNWVIEIFSIVFSFQMSIVFSILSIGLSIFLLRKIKRSITPFPKIPSVEMNKENTL